MKKAAHVAGLFLVAWCALWTVEVLGHLDLLKRLASRSTFIASAGDFVALVVADAHIALAATTLTLIAAVSTRALSRTGHRRARSASNGAFCSWRRHSRGLSAVVTGVTAFFLAVQVWHLPALVAWLVVAAITAAAWTALRRWLPPFEGPGFALLWTVAPALGLALLVTCVSEVVDWAPRAALFHALALAALLGVLKLIRTAANGFVQRALCWTPTVAALAAAVYSCLAPPLLPTAAELSGGAAGHGRPDIVLIVLDTVRADHLRSYGYSRDTMPNLETWARGALTVKRAVSAAGWTTPAHASLFSGLTVSRHGVHYASSESSGWLRTTAIEGIDWLPEQLADQGYYCLAVSANEFAVPRETGGFQRILTPKPPSWQHWTVGGMLDGSVGLVGRLGERLRWRMPYVDAEAVVGLAIRATPDDAEPVFLFINVMEAHSPYNPRRDGLKRLAVDPPRLFDRYVGHRDLTVSWPALPEGKRQALVDLYDGELASLDGQLERLLNWIDRRFPEALIVVTSDHGEELGEDGRVGHEYGLHQRLIHVPLFVRHPELGAGVLEPNAGLVNLYHLIRDVGEGRPPDPDRLLQVDDWGLISERYPSSLNGRTLGPAYLRFWISSVEDDLKAVGPSSHGIEIRSLGREGFSREVAGPRPQDAEKLVRRVDRYFEKYRDAREEPLEKRLSPEESERLRSLGYLD